MGRRKTHAEFVAEVEALVGDEYAVIGVYSGALAKIEVRHNDCGHEYEVQPNSILRGHRCPKCAVVKSRKTTEEFKRDVLELEGDEYSVIGEYKYSAIKIKMKHNTCEYEYDVRPNDFLGGKRCPKCNPKGKPPKTTKEFKREVVELVGDEYSVLGDYVNSSTKIEMKHRKCNHEYKVAPNNFINGSRCPKCRESKGERVICDYLKSNGYTYSTQFEFDDCKDKRSLKFDAVVFNNDNSIKCLIEYDGEYHYISYEFSGGDKKLHVQQRRDAIKTKYCADHNIPLMRIPYWEFDNIDAILTKELRKLGVIETENIAS